VSLTGYVVRRLIQLVPIRARCQRCPRLPSLHPPRAGHPARTILGESSRQPQKVALLLTIFYIVFGGFVFAWGARTSRCPCSTGGSRSAWSAATSLRRLFYSGPGRRLVVRAAASDLWLIGPDPVPRCWIACLLAAPRATKRDRLPDQIVRAVPLVGRVPAVLARDHAAARVRLHLGAACPSAAYGNGCLRENLHSMSCRRSPSRHRESLRNPRAEPAGEPPRGVRVGPTSRPSALPRDCPRAASVRHRAAERGDLHWSVLGRHTASSSAARSSSNAVRLAGNRQLMIKLDASSATSRSFQAVHARVRESWSSLVYLLTDVVHALLDPRVRFDCGGCGPRHSPKRPVHRASAAALSPPLVPARRRSSQGRRILGTIILLALIARSRAGTTRCSRNLPISCRARRGRTPLGPTS